MSRVRNTITGTEATSDTEAADWVALGIALETKATTPEGVRQAAERQSAAASTSKEG